MVGMRSWLASLRVEDGLLHQSEDKGVGCGTPPDEVTRHDHRVVQREPDGPSVEKLVVQGAEGQGVGHLIGSMGRRPADVGRLDADCLPEQLPVVPADRRPSRPL
jgi:hypothetical protein